MTVIKQWIGLFILAGVYCIGLTESTNLRVATHTRLLISATPESSIEGAEGSTAAKREGYANNKGHKKENAKMAYQEDAGEKEADYGVGEQVAEAEEEKADENAEKETKLEKPTKKEATETTGAENPGEPGSRLPAEAPEEPSGQGIVGVPTGGGNSVIINNNAGCLEEGQRLSQNSESNKKSNPSDIAAISFAIQELYKRATAIRIPIVDPGTITNTSEAQSALTKLEEALRKRKEGPPQFRQVDADDAIEEAKQVEEEAEMRDDENREQEGSLAAEEEATSEEKVKEEKEVAPPKLKKSKEEAVQMFRNLALAMEKIVNMMASAQSGRDDVLGTDGRLEEIKADQRKTAPKPTL